MNLRNPDSAANYVNLSWIAHRWGVALSTVVRSHIGTGKLSVKKHGRDRLVHIDDLARYEDQLRRALQVRRQRQLEKTDAFLAALNNPLPLIGT